MSPLDSLIPPVSVPPAISGLWRVETFEVSEEASRTDFMRNLFRGERRGVLPGRYTRLKRDGEVVMSDTPAEKQDHADFVRAAKGSVLINGLGLGMVAQAVLLKPEVRQVTIVEISSDVIALVGPTLAHDPRVKLIEADALTWKAPTGARFGAVWHDIWTFICADNLDEMVRLHRRYGQRCDWQGSWAREECEAARRRWR